MNRRISVAVIGALSATVLALPLSATGATTPHKPAAVTSVTPWAQGENPGDIKLSWNSTGAYTTYYKVETATTEFSPYAGSSLPRKGRNWAAFKFTKTQAHQRNGAAWVNITAAQLKAAGAGASLESGNHLYFRVYAVNAPTSTSYSWTAYPYEKIVRARGLRPTGASPLRVADYNVKIVGVKTDSGQMLWKYRGPRIAQDVIAANPGIVTFQELLASQVSTTPYSGQAKVDDSQAAWMLKYLRAQGVSKYALTRISPYTWSPSGIQGARILYDTTKYRLLSDCREQNSQGQFQSPSCGFMLYKRPVDGEDKHRWAGVAQFQEVKTGKRFWVASLHLDNRNSGTYDQRKAFEELRRTQLTNAIAEVHRRQAAANATGQPIIIGMDQNTWQSIDTGFLPHYSLNGTGFYDTAAALTRTNFQYATENAQFEAGEVQKPTPLGAGARLDVIATEGMPGALAFKIWHHDDTLKRSDHNMVTADLELP